MKIYREIVRNLESGIQAHANLAPYVEDAKLKQSMLEQKTAMEDMLERAKSQLSGNEQEQAKAGKLQKTMMKAGVSVNAMLNNDVTHLSSMLIEGYDMGITSVQKCINELKRKGDEIPPLAGEVIKFYDKSIKALRSYL